MLIIREKIIIACSLFIGATLIANSQAPLHTSIDRALQAYSPDKKLVTSWLNNLNQRTAHDHFEYSTNQILNRINYSSDIEHWHTPDYWATPIEFIGTNAGDCEDYAISKLFTLIARGVDPSTLKLMHVRALEMNEAHMVLLHTPNAQGPSYVYDSLKNEILTTDQRIDLKPIYAFNANGLWIGKKGNLNNKVRSSSGSRLWDDLVLRSAKQGLYFTRKNSN